MGRVVPQRGRAVAQRLIAFYQRLADDAIPLAGAALAYYALLSIVPLLLFAIGALGALVTAEDLARLVGVLGLGDLGETVRAELLGAVVSRGVAGGISLVALVLSLWAGSQVFVAYAQYLERVWGIADRKPFWLQRLRALVMVLLFAVLIAAAVLGLNVRTIILAQLPDASLTATLAVVGTQIVVWLWATGLFALTTAVLPARRLSWRSMLAGAALGAAIWVIATAVFAWISTNMVRYSALYGALGAAVVLLIWFYISGLSLLLAAEFACVFEGRAAHDSDSR